MPTSKQSISHKSKKSKSAKNDDVSPETIVKAGESQAMAFLDFIRTQGVIGLGVGLVLGSAVTIMVKSLIDNVVMPPIGLMLGSAEGIKGLSFTIGSVIGGKQAVINYGIFLNDFINFLVIAVVVYVIIRLLKFEKIDKKKN
jgi:large conductance mechanosensitive channel